MAFTAAYLVQDATGPREPMDWTPEFSRRARGLAVYAILRSLGREGVAELVDRLCACADRFADRLPGAGYEVMSHGLNQVLVALGSDADDGRRARGDPGGGHVLAERHDLARAAVHPHLRLQPPHDVRRRRPVGRRDGGRGRSMTRAPTSAELVRQGVAVIVATCDAAHRR